ncbi:hypothetical protein F4778DRAFT_780081 [Xylariomycetidae sp. FL2044]|nr:hypothetical protein F4778DRAFT_780081 [Xylariomycetidae sp. FL2044]
MYMYTVSDIVSTAFGALCIVSALPLVGAGYAGALLRLAVGSSCIYPPTRIAALLLNAAVVCRGTFLAIRDNRPMRPQWNMLGAIGLCFILELATTSNGEAHSEIGWFGGR